MAAMAASSRQLAGSSQTLFQLEEILRPSRPRRRLQQDVPSAAQRGLSPLSADGRDDGLGPGGLAWRGRGPAGAGSAHVRRWCPTAHPATSRTTPPGRLASADARRCSRSTAHRPSQAAHPRGPSVRVTAIPTWWVAPGHHRSAGVTSEAAFQR
jgi:hypothetical protein